MKIINLDELEQKCIEFGLSNNLFTRDDLGDKNLFSINIKGCYREKSIEIWIKGLVLDNPVFPRSKPLSFTSDTWENLYYQLDEFFRAYWVYTADNNKMPLYMKLCEAISRHSKNGFVSVDKIHQEITKEL